MIVNAARTPEGVRFRVDGYRGNLVATRDLRRFGVQVPAGATDQIDTPLGRLSTRSDGAAQIFDIPLAPDARGLPVYYYSDGAVARLQ